MANLWSRKSHGRLQQKARRSKTSKKHLLVISNQSRKKLKKDHQLKRENYQRLNYNTSKISKRPFLVIFLTMPKRSLNQVLQ
jgi:hypothetical protein